MASARNCGFDGFVDVFPVSSRPASQSEFDKWFGPHGPRASWLELVNFALFVASRPANAILT
eukprot:5335836-Pyramimonas_sp.AAC.1